LREAVTYFSNSTYLTFVLWQIAGPTQRTFYYGFSSATTTQRDKKLCQHVQDKHVYTHMN